MVKSSSQIGMACAAMERPQESAATKPAFTQGLVEELFPQVNWLLTLTIKVRTWSFHHQSLDDNPPIQIKRALLNWGLVHFDPQIHSTDFSDV